MEDIYLQKIRDGDTAAFAYFIKQYKDMAFTIAISILKNEQLAEETVQDAFVKAFEGLKKFKQQAKFSTWFYRIVVNESLRYRRKNKNEQFEPIENYVDEPSDESLLLSLEVKEQGHLINECLKHLSSNESLALRLFYLEEGSLKDLTFITGWTEANAKVILHRARKNMLLMLSKLMKNNF